MLALLWSRSDEQLVRRVLAGRRNDFGFLVQRHLPAVLSVARGHLKNTSDADDVAQESFLAAYQKLDTLRTPEKFAGWLLAIVRNTALNWQRRHKDEVPLEEGVLASLHQETVAPDRKEMQEMLHKTLMELPLESREVLLMHYYGGCSLREIAAASGISRDAAAKRLQRSREALGVEFLKLVPEARPASELKQTARMITAAVIAAGAVWRTVPAYGAVLGLVIGAAKLAGVVAGVLALAAGGFFVTPSLLGWEPALSADKPIATPAVAEAKPVETAVPDAPVAQAVYVEGEEEPTGEFSFTSMLMTPLAQAVGGAEVTLERVTWDAAELPPADTQKWTATADAFGTFTVNKLPPGNYSILAMTRFLGGASAMSISKTGEVRKHANIKMYPMLRSYGVLVDARNNPIPGAVIYPVAHDFFPGDEFDHVTVGGLRAATDDQGRFRFKGLLPGSWKFYIVSPDHAPYYTGSIPCYGLRSTVVMKDRGVLAGRVVDLAGQPLANIGGTVHTEQLVYRPNKAGDTRASYGISFPFTSDEKGEFQMDTLSPGKWFFSIEDKVLTLKNPRVSVDVGEGAAVRVELQASPGGVLSGKVVNKKTGTVVPDMKVVLSAGGGNLNINRDMVTGADGRYAFSGLPTGDFYISPSSRREYRSAPFERVHVEAGETANNHDLIVVPALMLSGHVVDGSGRPTQARVKASGMYQDDNTKTDENGAFALALREPGSSDEMTGGAPAGTEVKVIASSGKSASEEMAIDLTAFNGKEIELRLTGKAGASVEGTVLDADDKPVCNAQIAINREDGASMAPIGDGSKTTTDGSGMFLLTGLASGDYILSAYLPRGLSLGSTKVSVSMEGVTRDVIIKNAAAGNLTIEGTLFDPNHLPAPMAMLGLANGQTAITGPMGGFEFKGLGEGNVTLFAAVPGYSPLIVPGIDTGTRGLRLFLKKNATLVGSVVDAQTRCPVTDFTVGYSTVIQIPSDNQFGTGNRTVSDTQGRFRIESVPALPLRITVTAGGYAPWFTETAEPEGGGEVSIAASLGAAGTLSGVVRNEKGEPLSGALVGGTRTDAGGKFVFADLALGSEVQYVVTCEGYAPGSVGAVVGSVETVDVVLHAPGRVRVHALLNGREVPFGIAIARNLDTDASVASGQDGLPAAERIIENVSSGNVLVMVSAEIEGALLVGKTTIAVPPGQETFVGVPLRPEYESNMEPVQEGESGTTSGS